MRADILARGRRSLHLAISESLDRRAGDANRLELLSQRASAYELSADFGHAVVDLEALPRLGSRRRRS